MATSKFKGPVNSINGFYFHPASYASARPMTIACTSYVRTNAASAGATFTQLCGLSKCSAAWGNVRQPFASKFGTQLIMSVNPVGSGSTVTAQILANIGTGQRVPVMAGNATIDIFMLGYVS
jgi:hypothetical protein